MKSRLPTRPPLIMVLGKGRKDETGESPDVFEASFQGKTVVICLGNPYMKDDGAGLEVARRLRRAHLGGRIVVLECQSIDLALLWQFRSAERLVVVDTLESGQPVGSVSKYSILPRERPLEELPSLHGLRLTDVFDAAGLSGLQCPVTIIGVEPKECGAGEGLTHELTAAVPNVVAAVLAELKSPGHGVLKRNVPTRITLD